MSAAVIEAMLLRWSDSHTGRTVTLLLPDDGDDHPFRGLKCGPANGQRLALSVALIADDETQTPMEEQQPRPAPTNPSKTTGGAHSKPFNEMSGAQQAGILCRDPPFIKFLSDEIAAVVDGTRVANSEQATTFVREFCGVLSRSEIDKQPTAKQRWDRLVSDYRAWMRAPEVV